MKRCPECGFVSKDTQETSYCPCGDEKGRDVIMVEEGDPDQVHGQHFSTEAMK